MLDEERGLYIISVASRLLSLHPQTLRKYERAGFLIPNRTETGALRLYSAEDIQRLQLIKHLVDTLGLNLAGVELGLKLVSLLGQVQEDLEHLPEGAEVPKRVRKKRRARPSPAGCRTRAAGAAATAQRPSTPLRADHRPPQPGARW